MNKAKLHILIALKAISWVVLLVVFGYIIFHVWNRGDRPLHSAVRVQILRDKGLGFVNAQDVYRIVTAANPNWKHSSVQRAKTTIIENQVKENEYIKKAEVYIDHTQTLNIFVEPKEPKARIYQGEISYYLAEDWNKMSASTNFSKRVVQITGNTGGILNPTSGKDSFIQMEIKVLLAYLDQNEIWKNIIDQIHIAHDGRLEFYLQIIEPMVRMGFADSKFEYRMNKLHHFLSEATYYKNLDEYQTIDMQYSQQVIAVKKST